jgi:hypothetical protein
MNIGKINNSILKEEEYKKIINNLIDSYLNTKKTTKSVPIKFKSILLACDLSFLLHVYCCIFSFKYRQMSTSLFDLIKLLHYELINKYNDTDGRLILINVEINNTIFTLVYIYAPNCRSSRSSFFKKIATPLLAVVP